MCDILIKKDRTRGCISLDLDDVLFLTHRVKNQGAKGLASTNLRVYYWRLDII